MRPSILIDQPSIAAEVTAPFTLERGHVPATLFARGLAGAEDVFVQFLARDAAPAADALVEDGEDAWNEFVSANVVASADAGDKKVGAASAKFAVAVGAAANELLATEAIARLDLSGYDQIKGWLKSDVALAAGDLQLLLDDTAQCASPVLTLNLPAVNAGVWTHFVLAYDRTLAGLDQILSVGLKQVVDKGVANFWLDDLRAEQAWTDLLEAGTALKLDANNNLRTFDRPGQYRFRITAAAGPVQVGLY